MERKDTGLTFALKYIRKDEGPHLRSRHGVPLVREHADARQTQWSDQKACEISFGNGRCSSTSIMPSFVICAIAFRISNTCTFVPCPTNDLPDVQSCKGLD